MYNLHLHTVTFFLMYSVTSFDKWIQIHNYNQDGGIWLAQKSLRLLILGWGCEFKPHVGYRYNLKSKNLKKIQNYSISL